MYIMLLVTCCWWYRRDDVTWFCCQLANSNYTQQVLRLVLSERIQCQLLLNNFSWLYFSHFITTVVLIVVVISSLQPQQQHTRPTTGGMSAASVSRRTDYRTMCCMRSGAAFMRDKARASLDSTLSLQVQQQDRNQDPTNSFYPNVTTLRSGLCYRKSVCCLSSVCLSVTLVHPTHGVEAFRNISSPLCTLAILWPPCKILRI